MQGSVVRLRLIEHLSPGGGGAGRDEPGTSWNSDAIEGGVVVLNIATWISPLTWHKNHLLGRLL